MQILLGIGICLSFFLCLSGAFYLGYKQSKPKQGPRLTEQEKQQAQTKQAEFKEMMNFSLNQAIKGRRI